MPASCHSPSRIAVTGATGFVGRVLVARMAAAGLRPQLLLRRDAADLEALASKVVRGDLRDPEALAALVEGADTLVHLGGLIAAARVRDFQTVNVEATAALARLARAAGVQRVLQVSSLAAREPQLSPYAASKRAAEKTLLEEAAAFSLCIVRPPAVYGPGDRATLPIFQQLTSGAIAVPARPAARFSLIYVEDLARAILALLQRGGAAWDAGPLALDDGTREGYGWRDLAAIAGAHLGRSVRLLHLPPQLLAPAGLASAVWGRLSGRPMVLSPGKLRELAWPDWVAHADPQLLPPEGRPQIAFSEGFARTLGWYVQQGWLRSGPAARKRQDNERC